MSKIFDVVRKDKIIDFGDLYTIDHPGQGEPPALSEPRTDRLSSLPSPSFNGGRIVRLRLSTFSPIFPFDRSDDIAAEQYRIIRTKILHNPKKPRLIVVSSACSGDGKTVTSINIAASLALKDDSSVLLIDSDLRQPRVAEALGVPLSPGLAEILAGKADLDSALIRPEQFPNLFILTAGNAETSAAELLDSERWSRLVQQCRSRFGHVIFDAPPIAMLADYDLIQVACDAAILVMRPDHSSRAACLQALGSIPQNKMLGVVLNCVENWWLWKTSAYGYYRRLAPEERS